MALLTKTYLFEKTKTASPYLSEGYIREFAVGSLINEKRAVASTQTFDIFLSHSSEDAILIKALRDELVELGFSTYVDWIDDPQMDRSHVTKTTAETLRLRMGQCACLLFATSDAAKKSVWMPWELGYMDALRRARVGIVPIVPETPRTYEFHGQEYLGLYPYLDKTNSTLYMQTAIGVWVTLREWLDGENPSPH